jgi:hypothetical protein
VAITYVQGNAHLNGATSSSTVAVTLASAVGNGNMLVVSVGFVDSGTESVSSITDDKSNTYTLSPSKVHNANAAFSYQTGYVLNVTNAPITITATLAAAEAFLAIVVDEFSGVSSVGFDGSVGQAQNTPGTGTDAVTSTAITPTVNGDLIYGSAVSIASSGISAGTGFTQRQNVSSTYITESLIQGTAGSIAATFTDTSATDNNCAIVLAFKAAAATSLPPGQQSFSTPRPESRTTDWPIQLRNWIAPDRLILIGQDQLPPGEDLYATPDAWLAPERFAQWRTWQDKYKLTLIGQDRFPPGEQTNYLPSGISWRPESPQQNLQNTLLTTAPPSPPPGKQLFSRAVDPLDSFAQWRSWINRLNLNLIGQDSFPPGRRSFETPRGPQRGIDFAPGVNIALALGLPPGEQVYDLPPTLFDSFARWRFWASFNINLFPPPPPAVRPVGSQLYDLPPYGPIQSPPSFFINLLQSTLQPPPPIPNPAVYYLLEDLWLDENYLSAGSTQTTADGGGVLPVGWIPNPNVDPVNQAAIDAYRAAGYRERGLIRTQYAAEPVSGPNYVWQQINGVPVLVKVNSFPRII